MKKILPIVSVIALSIIVSAIFVSVNLVQKKEKQVIQIKAAPATTLSLDPSSANLYVGQPFTTNVKVNSGSNLVVQADLVLTYNPQVLEVTGVSAGNFLSGVSDIKKTIDNQTGKIIYGFYTLKANARQGEGVLASLTFRPKAVGTSSLSFGPQTFVGALNETQNALTSTTPASYVVQLNKSSLGFQIKFQGISSQKADRKVRVILKQGDVVKYTFNDVVASANTAGIYSGSVSDIDPGSYDVFIKGPVHLQRKFASVSLNPGQNSQDWSQTPLLAGDTNGDDIINGADILRVIEDYFPDSPPNSPADFNLDGTVNGADILLLIENYFKEGDK